MLLPIGKDVGDCRSSAALDESTDRNRALRVRERRLADVEA
jgi:hypothetical protein